MARTYGYHYLTEERKKMVEDNINFLWYFYGKYVSKANYFIGEYEKDEIVSNLYLNLCYAAEKYDSDRGAFSTCAILYLRGAYRQYVIDRKFYYERYESVPFFTGRGNVEEREDSTNFKVPEKGGVLKDPSGKWESEFVAWDRFEELFENSNLSDIEKYIVTLKFKDGYTYKMIGEVLGFGRGRVRQLIEKSIRKLKDVVERKNYSYEDFFEVSI